MTELRAMDSEFLKNGNKLLSLHSMDTTSLASSLFLLALAKNDVRAEILAALHPELPDGPAGGRAELLRGRRGRPAKSGAQAGVHLPVAERAVSVVPRVLPRPRVRGARPSTRSSANSSGSQIFKCRLVTELELNQRVKERALIEDAAGRLRQRAAQQRDRENRAKQTLELAAQAIIEARQSLAVGLANVNAEIDADLEEIEETAEAARNAARNARVVAETQATPRAEGRTGRVG